MRGAKDRGRIVRRLVVTVVVIAQIALVIRAYWSDHDQFGYQMFPESSEWRADIVRIDAGGDRIDVREAWPGGYRWGELVTDRGLDDPFHRHHADAGLASTLDFLQHALDWVARHTPSDHETLFLEAVVTTWDNGRGPYRRVLRSVERPEATP